MWKGRCRTSGRGGVHVCGKESAGLVAGAESTCVRGEESAYVGGEVQD